MTLVSQTKVSIISSAFSRIGMEPVSELTSQRVTQSGILQFYDQIRQARIEGFNWGFALREYSPAQLATPASDMTDMYQYGYQLPNECIHIIGLESGYEFGIAGSELFTDDSAPHILYAADIDAPNMTPGFCLALSIELASILAVSVSEDNSKKDRYSMDAEKQWAIARFNDSKQRSALKLKYERLLRRDVRSRY